MARGQVPERCLLASRDVDAAEAAGITWLPEEPELPGWVGLYMNCNVNYIHEEETGDWLLQVMSVPGRGDKEKAFASAVVALWNALGPAGDLRKRLEDAFHPRDSEGEEFITVRVALLTVLLAKPWEKP